MPTLMRRRTAPPTLPHEMAAFFKAHDPSIGRDVALKVLHASLRENADSHGRFLREARAAGGLSHPHTVAVHDVGEIDGRPCMAMALLTGGTLADELARGRGRPVRQLSEALAAIARGRFDHRIDQRRQDEFGQLFVDFNAMAQALQGGPADQRAAAAGRPTEAAVAGRAT